MNAILEIRDMNFSYNKQIGFNEFNLEVEEGDIITLVGSPSSGKTTLLKMLCHKLPNSSFFYNGAPFNSYPSNYLKNEIVVIFDSPITKSNIKEEIIKNLKVLNISQEEINSRYDELKESFELSKYESLLIEELPNNIKNLVKILRYIIIEPKLLAIDCMLSSLTNKSKIAIIDYIKRHNITLINVTNDLDDALLGNKMFVLDNFTLILEGNTESVLKTDTLLKKLGLKLPLPVDLSIELMHYDVLKKIYMSDEKLVNALWK